MKFNPKIIVPLFISCSLFWGFQAIAQTKEHSEAESTTVQYTDKGLEFRKGEDFYLKFRFRTQLRAGYMSRFNDDKNNGYEAMVRRFRLRFEGYLFSPKFEYKLQLGLANRDLDHDSGSPQIVRDAVFYYKPEEDWSFGIGQTKLPGNRERLNSSGELQMPDRSLANSYFTVDRDFGIFVDKDIDINNQWILLRTAVSSGEGRGQLETDNGLAYTGRVEYLPFGKFKDDGDYFEGDLEFEETPKLSMGFTYSKNFKAKRTGGQLGKHLYSTYDPEKTLSVDMETIMADAVLKYKGWAFLGEYYKRNVTNFSEEDFVVTPDDKTVFLKIPAGIATNLQLSKMVSKKDEIAVRYTTVTPHKHLKNYQYRFHTKALGYSHYFNKHKFKLQGYLGLDDRIGDSDELDDPFKNRINGMIQVEIGI